MNLDQPLTVNELSLSILTLPGFHQQKRCQEKFLGNPVMKAVMMAETIFLFL
jgi:hypothetical protein